MIGLLNWLQPTLGSSDANVPFHMGPGIDILVTRDDGALEMIVVIHGHLDNSARTQDLLEIKIKGYLQQRNSAAFNVEFDFPRSDRVHLVLETDSKLPRAIHGLLKKLDPMIQSENARLVIRGHQYRKHGRSNICFPILQCDHVAVLSDDGRQYC